MELKLTVGQLEKVQKELERNIVQVQELRRDKDRGECVSGWDISDLLDERFLLKEVIKSGTVTVGY